MKTRACSPRICTPGPLARALRQSLQQGALRLVEGARWRQRLLTARQSLARASPVSNTQQHSGESVMAPDVVLAVTAEEALEDAANALETGISCQHHSVAAADLIDLHVPHLGRLLKWLG